MDFPGKLVVDLKQQTPMIHFQYNESGATLRATELKPKLDEFLGTKIDINSEWRIKGTKALNYKVHITAYGKKETSRSAELKCQAIDPKNSKISKSLETSSANEINSMYFGNMVSTKNMSLEEAKEAVLEAYKETVFYTSNIRITFLCFIDELRDAIVEHIQEFFFVHNFGTRQSKGFGGFTVENINGVKCKNDFNTVKDKLSGYKYFYMECNPGDDMLFLSSKIYSALKGDFILNKFLQTNKKSDKDLIKEEILSKSNENSTNTDESKNSYTFVRALLGLADIYEYKEPYQQIHVYHLEENGSVINRFKSPVTIKIIETFIFFIFDEKAFPYITGKKFYFMTSNVHKESLSNTEYLDKKIKEKAVFEITTPSEVNVGSLITNFVDNFNGPKKSKKGQLKAGGVING